MTYVSLSEKRAKLGLKPATDTSSSYTSLNQARTQLLSDNAKKISTPSATIKKPSTKKEQPTPIQQAQSNIIKLSKEPVIGKTLQLAKGAVDVGVSIAKQTALDLFNITKETAIAWTEIPASLKAFYEKDKTYKPRELSESAKRGQEIVFAGTKAGGFQPELGAVKGNVGFILKQGKNDVVDKIIKVMPKGKSEPQEVINAVVKSGTETTKEGKALIKASLDIQKEGKLVQVESPKVEVKPITKPVVEIQKPIAQTEAKIPTSEKIVEKTVSVPREQLPVASKEGIEKISRLEARVTQSLEKTPQEIKDQLGSTFTTMNKKEQISKASRYVTEKPEEAMAVLRGEKEAPKDILKNSIYVAMENSASEDVELARKLASLASTREGQELSILTEIDKNSPVKIMRDVVKIREESISKRFSMGTKETVKKNIENIKYKKPDRYDWNNFLKSVQC